MHTFDAEIRIFHFALSNVAKFISAFLGFYPACFSNPQSTVFKEPIGFVANISICLDHVSSIYPLSLYLEAWKF